LANNTKIRRKRPRNENTVVKSKKPYI